MPKVKTNQLTIKSINEFSKNAPIGSNLLDGNNLYLKKTKTGLFWHYRVAFKANTGYKNSWLSFGGYPEISIINARNQAIKTRELINRGINPKTIQTKLTNRLGKNLGNVLTIYQGEYYPSIKPNTKKVFMNAIKHLQPLHNVLIEDITEYDILDIAETVKRSGSLSVADYLIQFTKRLFAYAKQEGYILDNKIRDLKSTYSFKPKERFMQPQELGQFVRSMMIDKDIDLIVKVAVYSLIILMVRRSELVNIRCNDINLDDGRLVIEHTKTINNFTLIVPHQIRKLWALLIQNNQSKNLIFGISDNTLYRNITALSLKYINKRITPHDTRRTAMSLLAEQGHNYLVIDSALAHTIKGVNRSYLKSTLLEEREKLLQSYADYIDGLIGGSVVDILVINKNHVL